MVFDPTKPAAATDGVSAELRANFQALAIDHAGPTAPSPVSAGYTWLNTADTNNKKVMKHNGAGWVVLFEHIESVAVPASVEGAAGQLAEAQNADQLQGRAVAATAPTAAQVLTWNGAAWAPAAGGGGGEGLTPSFAEFTAADPVGTSTIQLEVAQQKCRIFTGVEAEILPYSGHLFGAPLNGIMSPSHPLR